MKRALSLLLSILMVLSMLPVQVFAAETASGTCGDNLTWVLDDSGSLTISGSGEIVCQYSPMGYLVGEWAFDDSGEPNYITEVIIEPGVTKIDEYSFGSLFLDGEYFFTDYRNLSDVSIPNTVTTIGDYAFYYTGLTSVRIPASVTSIGNYCFGAPVLYGDNVVNTSRLTEIYFEGSACEIADDAFSGVTATVYYPYSDDSWTIETRGNYGGELTWVALDENGDPVEVEEEDSNSGTCGDNLIWVYDEANETLTISGTGEMTEASWNDVGTISNVVIEEGVTSICANAFAGNAQLTSVSLADSIESIGMRAFTMCVNLRSVNLPVNLRSIGMQAFNSCAMSAITIPAQVEVIQDGVFSYCNNLTSLSVASANEHFAIVDGVLFTKDMSTLVFYPVTKTSAAYTVPAGVKTLMTRSFTGNEYLTEIIMPEGLTVIGAYVFNMCTKLGKVELPDSLTTIGECAFPGCSSLSSIVIPQNVTLVESGAFYDCTALKSITFTGDAPQINDYAESFTIHTFSNVTATAYYPADNDTWTSDVMQNYGGSITWVAVCTNGHSEETVPGKDATCTEKGLTDGKKCSVCGTVTVEQKEIPAKGHTEETVKGKAATCTEAGLTDGKKCSVCGTVTVEQKEIPAKGHTEETVKGKAATCTEAGLTDGKKCSVCGTVTVKQETIPARGHTYENGKCKNCGEAEAVKVAAPKITGSTVSASGKPKVSWKAVDGAAKYQVYRSTKKTSGFKRVTTTTKLSYTDTKAEAGTQYYYKVKSVDEDGKTSGYSNRISRLCDLARPDVTATNVASSGKIKLSWPAVEGAVKYQIYRSKTGKDGSFGRIATVTGTTYTNTSTTAGVKYYYKVKAIHTNSDANSVFSEVESRVCDLGRPTISIKRNNAGKPRISWNSVDGAVKYEVYRATSKNGKYTRIATTKNNYQVNKNAVAGKTYYYKVKAIHSNTNANSAFSTIKYIKAK